MLDWNLYTFEELQHATYMKGLARGIHKITDKTGWRECVIADLLDHEVYAKISSGAGTLGEGSDALNKRTGKRSEYKSQAIEKDNIKNLLQKTYKRGDKIKTYVPLKIRGIYNNAMKSGAIESYKEIDHYFGLFYREKCVLIIRVETEYVISSLKEQVIKRKNASSTNLCTVTVDLGKKELYDVVYDNRKWLREQSLLEQ